MDCPSFNFDDSSRVVYFQGALFVLTGIFTKTTREHCALSIFNKGGRIADRVTESTDYVVVGSQPNPEWKYPTHGNKILRALELKQQLFGIAIISEDHFLKCFNGEIDTKHFVVNGAKLSKQVIGKHFTFSGNLRGIKRQRAEDLVQQAGGIVEYTVTKSRTDYVVTDYSGGSELDKARKWGKPIIGGKELLAMLTGDA